MSSSAAPSVSGFDPYHKWLSIPPAEQPPDHYRLLALPRFESDPEVIGNAADQRMVHLRNFQTGRHAADSQRLLNEVARARLTLLDPRRKAAYDTVLRSAAPADAEPAAPSGPAPKPEQTGLALGQAFGRLRLAEVLRSTRWAVTFRAEDLETGQPYSLKVLTPQAARDGTFQRRFLREVEITTRLKHANLVGGYQGGQWQGWFYLVGEYVVGTDLQTLVGHYGPLSVDYAVECVDQAARGLAELHQLGVFHRNVTPRNLLVDLHGQLKVTNLFLARIQEGSAMDRGGEELTQMGDTMGTSEYLPPEQSTNPAGVDQRADIYSLGCTLFYLLMARPVYGGRSMIEKVLAHSREPIPSLCAQRDDVPAWLDRVFQRMVAKQPADRYASMVEVSQALAARQEPSFWSWLRGLVSRLRKK